MRRRNQVAPAALSATAEYVLNRFLSELETWRAEHPGWTEREQSDAFPPVELWRRAGGSAEGGDRCDGALYARLMEIAGYLMPATPGEDTNLPCGWPGRGTTEG